MLVVTHNQEHARRLGGITALLAGGRIVESAPTDEFFSRPVAPAARQFCRTGSCHVPSPSTLPEELEPDAETPIDAPPDADPPPVRPPRTPVPAALGPRGFAWLQVGRIGGTPLPGLMNDLDADLAALARVGVTVLVSLTAEFPPVPEAHLARFGIRGLRLPMRDMDAPEIDDALELCGRIAGRLAEGEVVALHCKAGLGRTGTLLAAWLIREGASAVEALTTVRAVEPRWVQSARQVRFLEELAATLAERSRLVTATPSQP